jgi:hypothetical protein
VRAVREFQVELGQAHNDTTTVTFTGAYRNQQPPEQRDRPPRITFGYNKDHGPDLKQLLFSITQGTVGTGCSIPKGNCYARFTTKFPRPPNRLLNSSAWEALPMA